MQEVDTWYVHMVGSCRCVPDLTFDLAPGTLAYKSCLGCISETVRCRKLILVRDISWGM